MTSPAYCTNYIFTPFIDKQKEVLTEAYLLNNHRKFSIRIKHIYRSSLLSASFSPPNEKAQQYLEANTKDWSNWSEAYCKVLSWFSRTSNRCYNPDAYLYLIPEKILTEYDLKLPILNEHDQNIIRLAKDDSENELILRYLLLGTML